MSSGSATTTGLGAVGAKTRLAMLAACDPSIPQNDTLSIEARDLDVTVRVTVNASSTATTTLWALSGTPTTTGIYTVKLAVGNYCGTTTRAFMLNVATGSASVIR